MINLQRQKQCNQRQFAGQFSLNQTLQFMSLSEVKQALFQSNLNFDSQMANEVFSFLSKHGIVTDVENLHIKSIACAAILSQIKQVPKINDYGYTRYGITIETVMSHLNGYSKQQFLQVVGSIIIKDQGMYNKLSTKIKNVQLSYRLFKKYRKVFQQLWALTGNGNLVMNDMLCIFWVIYLLIKNKNDQIYADIQQQIHLLVILIKSVFQYWIANLEDHQINNSIQQIFNCRDIGKMNEQFFLSRHLLFLNQVQKLYSIRYQNKKLDFKKFSKNAIQIARFLDDITNHFYKEKQLFQIQNYIDEISFLELKKILAPKTNNKPEQSAIQPIGRMLNFSKDEKTSEDKKQNINDINLRIQTPTFNKLQQSHYMIVQNLTEMTPLRQRRDLAGVTPCSNRLQNLEWIRNCLDMVLINKNQSEQLFRKIVSLTQKQTSAQYQKTAKTRLLQLIEEFTPKCIKKEKRIEDIFTFFKFFIFKIFKNHNQSDNTQMFRDAKTFNSILCLSSDIFNFAYSSSITSYRRLSKCFQVPLIQSLKPINWIGKNIEMPKEMHNYLYLLEKRIVIKQIWEDQTGYNLIKSQEIFKTSYQIGYNDMIVWKRLLKHTFDRIDELSKQVKIQYKLIKRIQTLVQHILKEKPHLLYKNKIDQIIICCMTSFLSINQIHKKQTLEKVFRDYNKIQMSYNQNRQGLTGDGKEMSLVEFYNEIFLPEIQDIIKENMMTTDFLLTPIRQSHEQTLNNDGELTPFTTKYKQNQIDFAQPRKKISFSAFNLSTSPLLSQSNFKKQKSQFFSQFQSANYRTKLFLKNKQKMEEIELKQLKQSQNSQNLQSNQKINSQQSEADNKLTQKI